MSANHIEASGEDSATVRHQVSSGAALAQLKQVRVSSAAVSRANTNVKQKLVIRNSRLGVSSSAKEAKTRPQTATPTDSVDSKLLRPSSVTVQHVQQQDHRQHVRQRHVQLPPNTLSASDSQPQQHRIPSFARATISSSSGNLPKDKSHQTEQQQHATKSWRAMREENAAEAKDATEDFVKLMQRNEERQKRQDRNAFLFRANDDEEAFFLDGSDDESDGEEGDSQSHKTPTRPQHRDEEQSSFPRDKHQSRERKNLSYVARNKQQVTAVARLVQSGQVDDAAAARRYRETQHAQDVRRRMVDQFREEHDTMEHRYFPERFVDRRWIKGNHDDLDDMLRGLTGQQMMNLRNKAATMAAFEHYTLRVCTWGVVVALVQSWRAVHDICRSQVRVEADKRRHQAADVLGKHLPVLMRRRKRSKSLKRLTVVCLVVLCVCKRKRAVRHQAARKIVSFLRVAQRDKIMHIKRFYRQVAIIVRVVRAFTKRRAEQLHLLRLQWEAMEACLLLHCPTISGMADELRKVKGIRCLDDETTHPESERLTALPPNFPPQMPEESYINFLLRWRKFVKNHGNERLISDLPPSLHAIRCISTERDAEIAKFVAQRHRRQSKLVNHAYSVHQSERSAAADLAAATHRLKHETALIKTRVKFPTLREDSRLFHVTVGCEEQIVEKEDFFQQLMTNVRGATFAKIGNIERLPILMPERELETKVKAALRKSKVNWLLRATGTGRLVQSSAETKA